MVSKNKKFKNILIYLLPSFLTFCTLFYCILFFALPGFINSNYFLKKIETVVYKKTNANIKLQNHNLTISKNLNLNLKIDKITIESALLVENIEIDFNIFLLSLKKLNASYMYADAEQLKTMFGGKNQNKNKKTKFKFSKISKLHIAKSDIVINDIKLKVQNLKFISKTDCDFNISAQNIPVDSLMELILKYQKSKDSSKKFIENFVNYKGLLSFDLTYENKNLSGFLKADKLSAIYLTLNSPLYFEQARFDIKNNMLTSIAYGFLGGNNAQHNLKITNILSPHREVFGQISAPLDDKISRKYFRNNIKILKSTDASVAYHIKDKIVQVEYFLNLNKGSDIFYKDAYLGLRDKKRKLYVQTVSDGKRLFLKNYSYSIVNNNKIHNIAKGEGLFVKQKKQFKPRYITCRTNGYAPVSVTGFFGRYLKGGEFRGNLKYDFTKKTLSGNFDVINTIFNDFFVEKASVLADEKKGNIKAKGKYKKQDFSCDAQVRNKFDGTIVVYDMNLFLDKYIIKKNTKNIEAKPKNSKEDFSERMRKIDMTIEKWSIDVNEITFDKVIVQNIKLFGKLQNSIFEFSMPPLYYAKGLISAKGKYNFEDDSSNIFFNAENIDSDFAAEKFLDLHGQIQGTAKAEVEIKTFKKMEEIYAKSAFEVNNGFLPKLGNFEFMAKKSKNGRKIRISDLTNADLTRAKALNSDIKGSFEFNNYKLENINLTSQQESLAMFIEGAYHIKKEDAALDIYGKYDMQAPKGIKILFVPLNWILNIAFSLQENKDKYKLKINRIPSINSKNNKVKFFKINLKGNLNAGDLKVNIKGLK